MTIQPMYGMLQAVFIFFSPYLGIGSGRGRGGVPRDWYTTCVCHFFTLDSTKFEVSEAYSFDILITENDHPTYVWYVVGSIYLFFTLFGYWFRARGGVPRDWYTTCICSFSPWTTQNLKFPKLNFLIF